MNYILNAMRTMIFLRLEGKKTIITLPVTPVKLSDHHDDCVNMILRRVY